MPAIRPTAAALLLALSLAAGAAGQTTGCANLNDYTINGFTPLSTSCGSLVLPSSGSLTFSVSVSSTATSVTLYFTLCPCFPNVIVLPPCGFKYQSVDLVLSCPLGWVTGTPTAGVYSFTVPPFSCPVGFVFSTQAVAIDPGCSSGFVITQAYRIACL